LFNTKKFEYLTSQRFKKQFTRREIKPAVLNDYDEKEKAAGPNGVPAEVWKILGDVRCG